MLGRILGRRSTEYCPSLSSINWRSRSGKGASGVRGKDEWQGLPGIFLRKDQAAFLSHYHGIEPQVATTTSEQAVIV